MENLILARKYIPDVVNIPDNTIATQNRRYCCDRCSSVAWNSANSHKPNSKFVRVAGYAIFQTTLNFQNGGWLANYGYSPKVFCITRRRIHVTVEQAQCIHNISARATLPLPLQFFRMRQRIAIVGTCSSLSIEFAITYRWCLKIR